MAAPSNSKTKLDLPEQAQQAPPVLPKKKRELLNPVALAMLISFLFENSSEQNLKKAAEQVISRRGIFNTNKHGLNVPGNFSVKSIKLDVPLKIEKLRQGKIEGANVSIIFELSDVKIRNLGDFTTKKENNKMNMNFDDLMFTANFTLNGTVEEIAIKESGTAGIILNEVIGDVLVNHEVAEITGETRLTDVAMNFNFKSAQFIAPDKSDLGMRNVVKLDVKRLMNTATKIYIRQNMSVITKGISESIKEMVNQGLRAKTRDELIAFLNRDEEEFQIQTPTLTQ